jgi:hypothetical protein
VVFIGSRASRSVEGLSALDALNDGGMEDGVARPDGPGDTSEFVGQGDSGPVVAAALLDGESPAAQAIRLV